MKRQCIFEKQTLRLGLKCCHRVLVVEISHRITFTSCWEHLQQKQHNVGRKKTRINGKMPQVRTSMTENPSEMIRKCKGGLWAAALQEPKTLPAFYPAVTGLCSSPLGQLQPLRLQIFWSSGIIVVAYTPHALSIRSTSSPPLLGVWIALSLSVRLHHSLKLMCQNYQSFHF